MVKFILPLIDLADIEWFISNVDSLCSQHSCMECGFIIAMI